MTKEISIPDEVIVSKIYLIRGQKVMIDRDLAELYGVETRDLNKAVKRNLKRFPEDFMFQLNNQEFKILMFQNGTSSWGGTRKAPNAFTESGVAMLSSIINSDTAIEVNIRIIRVFTKLREIMFTHKDILIKLEQLEKTMINQGNAVKKNEEEIQLIFQYLKKLLTPTPAPRKRLGYKRDDES